MRNFIIIISFLFSIENSFAQSKNISIDSLEIGQKYYINVESKGCFHHSELQLTFSKKPEGYFETFEMKGFIEDKKVKTKFKRTQLTKSKLDSLRKFERELIIVSSQRRDCTTVDTYSLSISNDKNVHTVDDCDWPGIGKLIGVLFKGYQ